MNFSEWMRKRRELCGISIYQLATETGISRQQLMNYERERSNPTLDKANKVCKALHGEFILGRK